jgi:nucleotidyltransferase substrate binding protein (TIGR01987 family)
MERPTTKLENLVKALHRLKEAACAVQRKDDAIIRDGLIQRFEFTYELIWKALKEYLEENGIFGKNSPKAVFKQAYALGLITNEQTWLSVINDRISPLIFIMRQLP